MKALLVDDEPLARRRLARLLDKVGGVEIVGEAGNGTEALQRMAELAPDVVFVDIRMPGLDGVQLAKLLPDGGPHVVFVTAYDEHAVDAFEAAAVDYLLKPVELERLAKAVERVRRLDAPPDLAGLLDKLAPPPALTGVPRVHARQGDRVFPVDARSVTRFHASDKYVLFEHEEQTLLLEESLNSLEERLEGHGFLRVHRAELINVAAVKALRSEEDGVVAELSDGQEAQVSRRMVKALKTALGL